MILNELKKPRITFLLRIDIDSYYLIRTEVVFLSKDEIRYIQVARTALASAPNAMYTAKCRTNTIQLMFIDSNIQMKADGATLRYIYVTLSAPTN